jgi:hypothetical protein
MLARAVLPKRGGVTAAFLRASSSTIPRTHVRPMASPRALLAVPYPYPSIRYLSTTMKTEEDAGECGCVCVGRGCMYEYVFVSRRHRR